MTHLHELAVGIKQVQEDTMIHQIIVLRFRRRGRGEVHPIRFADCLGLLVGAVQTYETGVEVFEILGDAGGGVACRVDGDEDGLHVWAEGGFCVGPDTLAS